MTRSSNFSVPLLALALCVQIAAPASAQQDIEHIAAPRVTDTPKSGAGPADGAARKGIIVVGGTPAEAAATPVRVDSAGALNPQPLPPRPPWPPRTTPPVTAPGAPPARAERSGIIVVGGKVERAAAGTRELQREPQPGD
jgi:hypothetical protein